MRRAFVEVELQCVKECAFCDGDAELAKAECEELCFAVDCACDRAKSVWAVVDRVHARHDREQRLGRTDVTRRAVAADVLLAGLQRQAISHAAFSVFGDADEATGHLAFELVFYGHVRCVRTTKAHGDTEALCRTDRDIRTKFTRSF